MDINLWGNSDLLSQWINKHYAELVYCDFYFDVKEPSSDPLIYKIADTFEFDSDNIAIGAGISGLLHSIINLPCWKKIVFFSPEFGLYKRIIKNSYHSESSIEIRAYEVEDVFKGLKDIHSSKNDLLCFSSPRWFSGERLCYEDIISILNIFQGTILIDEAYVDYSYRDKNIEKLAEENERVIILRSFSKGWFLSGLRIGYMISKKYAMYVRNEIIPPHPVASISAKFVMQLLDDKYLMECFFITRKEIISEREKIYSYVKNLSSFGCYKSQSNFLTIIDKERKISDNKINILGLRPMEPYIYKYWIIDAEHTKNLLWKLNYLDTI